MENLHKKNMLEQEQKNDESNIDTAALSTIGDEDDLTAALSGNPIKLALTRAFIKVKNHVDIIPMIMTVVTLCVIYVSMHDILYALAGKLPLNDYNSFLFFVNLVLQIVLCLCYINVSGKRTGKTKKWLFFGLYLLVAAGSIVLDLDFIQDVNVHLSMFNGANAVKDPAPLLVAQSRVQLHLIFLIVTIALAILAPIVQPITKKLHLGKQNRVKKQ